MKTVLVFISVLFASLANAEPMDIELTISEPYLELHTGPGNSYRIEHVLEQGEKVIIKKQNADWFYLVQNEKVNGWASLDHMLDNQVEVAAMTFDEFMLAYEGDLRFDLSFSSGFIEDDFFLGLELGHRYDKDTRLALNIRQVPGKISETLFVSVDWNYFFQKIKTVTPLLVIGYGLVESTPSDQIIGGDPVSTEFWKVGGGLVFAQSKRISFTAVLNQYRPVEDVFDGNLVEIALGLNYFY